MSEAEAIRRQIDELKLRLKEVDPLEGVSLREIATRAGISIASAHRFKNGAVLHVETAKALMGAGFITVCPCCGAGRSEERG